MVLLQNSGDQLIAIIAKYENEKGQLKNNTVVTTVMSNMGLGACLGQLGIHHLTGSRDRVIGRTGESSSDEVMPKKFEIVFNRDEGKFRTVEASMVDMVMADRRIGNDRHKNLILNKIFDRTVFDQL